MAVNKGDFILLNYTCKIKESGETVDTTVEKIAKDAKLHKEGTSYEPRFVVVGEGWVPKGLDESFIGLETGKTVSVEVPPEKGHGSRDPSKIKLLPLRRFKAEGLAPAPGLQVEIDGRPALVRAVGAGRVQVDFNHPLAGKTLIYEVSVEKVLQTQDEKVKAIIHRRIPNISVEKFATTIMEREVNIEIPEEAFLLEGLQVAKRVISNDLQKYFQEIAKVSFIEIFKKAAPVAAEAKPEQVQVSEGTR